MSDKYIERELLPNVVYRITESEVSITNDSTSWVHIERPKKFVKKELLDMYSVVRAAAKANGITLLGFTGLRKYILENWEEYLIEYSTSESLFLQMSKLAKRIEKRGIRWGCLDDELLDKMGELNNSYHRLYYRTTVLSKMSEIQKTLRTRCDCLGYFVMD